jgi:hypothetical protein
VTAHAEDAEEQAEIAAMLGDYFSLSFSFSLSLSLSLYIYIYIYTYTYTHTHTHTYIQTNETRKVSPNTVPRTSSDAIVECPCVPGGGGGTMSCTGGGKARLKIITKLTCLYE